VTYHKLEHIIEMSMVINDSLLLNCPQATMNCLSAMFTPLHHLLLP